MSTESRFAWNPAWPDYFDVHPRFGEQHIKSFRLDSNGDLCHYNDICHIDEYGRKSWRNRWEVNSQIIGVTSLPDDLLWVRLIRCPDDCEGGSEGGYTYYEVWSTGIARWMAENPVTAYAYDGRKWRASTRYRWAAQTKLNTYVAPDPATYKAIAAQLMGGAE